MNLDDVFWHDILSRPDDDLPRLVYADWLEEQAEPQVAARGGFMHAQCALSRLSPEDPRRAALEDQARSLLNEHESAWTQPLLRRCRVDRWCFRRGAVEEIELSAAAFLEHAAELCGHLPLRRLRLTEAAQPAELARCPHLARIEILDLRYSRLGDAGVRTLLESPHLTSLTELDLTGTGIEAAGVEAVLTTPHLPRLRTLHLSRNRLSTCSWLRLFTESRRAELRELVLAQAEIEGDEMLRAAHRLPPLEGLDLSDNLFYPNQEMLCALLSSERLARLRRLRLRRTGLQERHVRHLAAAVPVGALSALDLGDNMVGDDGVRALAAAQRLAGLTQLELPRADIGDGARTLTEDSALTRLTQLDLRENRIGPEVRQLLRARLGDGLRN